MKTCLQLTRRRILPWFCGGILLLTLLLLGFQLLEKQQQSTAVQARIAIDQRSIKQNSKAKMTVFARSYAKEAQGLKAGPTQDAKNFYQLIKARQSTDPSLVLKAIPVTRSGTTDLDSNSTNEFQLTAKEYHLVLGKHLIPYFPSTMRIDETTLPRLSVSSNSEYDHRLNKLATTRYYTNGWYLLGATMRSSLWLVPIIGGLLLWGTLLPSELNRSHQQINLLRLNGAPEFLHVFAIFCLQVLGSLILTVIPAAVLLLVGPLTAPNGSLAYPELFWHLDGSQTFIPLWRQLLWGLALAASLTVFTVALAFVCGILTRSAFWTAAASLIILALGYFVQNVWWLPFSYLHFGQAVDGYTFHLMGQGSLTSALAVILVWSAGLFALGAGLWLRDRRLNFNLLR